MYKFSFILSFLLGVILSGNLTAQEVDFSVQVQDALNQKTSNGQIEVTIQKGTPAYAVLLFDKAPWKGGKELKRFEEVTETKVTFEKLLPGSYFVIVEDQDKNPQVKTVTVNITSD